MRYDCLIVDDEEMLSKNTQKFFNISGINTQWVADKESCIKFFHDNQADLILLDINLGNSSGFDLCGHLRETTNAPILFISARTSDDDILLALNVGGDDYIQKPYSLAVLLAKVKTVLKRYKTSEPEPNTLVCGKLKIDFASETAFLDRRELDLTIMERKLLLYLAKNSDRIVTKDELFKNVWEDSITGDNTLNVHIRHLREKIEADTNKPKYIKTVWGVGYIFSDASRPREDKS
ncbi:MAG: response regulator transcription factor [Oscillospiraceae bacterium]|nr:response regulator transcription factor [Oscillospiraceae bacterium]